MGISQAFAININAMDEQGVSFDFGRTAILDEKQAPLFAALPPLLYNKEQWRNSL
ncbi:hypothetical protein [uncultured Shewanella sp.]|uniref:hypothetical protein n=1 Tax=uncultured Shewanella sp. TaxID=173975 RepID=UPI00261164C5|nr:hypothetical protein [uncultured Shewanella sp.]